jgi:hypothetical protein
MEINVVDKSKFWIRLGQAAPVEYTTSVVIDVTTARDVVVIQKLPGEVFSGDDFKSTDL